MELNEAVRAAGVAGVLVSVAIGICDVVLLVGPRAVAYPWFEAMLDVPVWRLKVGGAVGAGLIPLMAIPMWHVYEGLAGAGPWLAAPPPILLAYFFFTGSALHFAFPYIGFVLQEGDRAGAEYPAKVYADAVYAKCRRTFRWLAVVSVSAFVVGSLWLALAIAYGATSYPRWFAIVNPLLLALLAIGALRLFPSRSTRALSAAFVHVGFTPFLISSTALLWNAF